MQEALFLLFVQIVTEALPISSSGHVSLLGNLSSIKACEVFSHASMLIIVAIFFFKEWSLPLCRLVSISPSRGSYRKLFLLALKIIFLVLVSDLITAIFFFSMQDLSWPLSIGFIFTSLALLSLRFIKKSREHQKFDLRKAILLGVVQGLATLPGISRFATTYVAARWLGIPVRRAYQVTFLIYAPLLIAAFLKSLLVPSWKVVPLKLPFSLSEGLFVVIIATIIGYLLFSFAHRCAVRRKLWLFGFYTLSLGLVAVWREIRYF